MTSPTIFNEIISIILVSLNVIKIKIYGGVEEEYENEAIREFHNYKPCIYNTANYIYLGTIYMRSPNLDLHKIFTKLPSNIKNLNMGYAVSCKLYPNPSKKKKKRYPY